ncbi:MAG: hypothetical protein NZ602_00780 [Thermoguttaceae bacterium]|nr:hypothetical protein [Thermoguttaceae bacterium]MDW8036836.1 hypothetical protein [Thermoguttaceae bacterium]
MVEFSKAWIRLAAIGLLLVGCLGCGSSSGRQAVTGTVSLDGKPLASGSINFQPAPGLKAPSAGAPIENGRFSIPADQGLLPGEYQVTIIGMQETGRMIDDEQKGKVPELAPIRFREAGNLKAKVEPGKKAHFDFQLTSVK